MDTPITDNQGSVCQVSGVAIGIEVMSLQLRHPHAVLAVFSVHAPNSKGGDRNNNLF